MTIPIKNKFSKSFKLKAINLILQEGFSLSEISKLIKVDTGQLHTWLTRYKYHGDKAFSDYRRPTKPYSSEFKLQVIQEVKQGMPLREAVCKYNLSSCTCLSSWIKQYNTYGIKGLYSKPSKKTMKKPKRPPEDINKLTLEQKLKLQEEELAALRAENAYLKKLDALMKQKAKKKQK